MGERKGWKEGKRKRNRKSEKGRRNNAGKRKRKERREREGVDKNLMLQVGGMRKRLDGAKLRESMLLHNCVWEEESHHSCFHF